MGLGNPERPVGGLSVRPPPGVELRPLARDDFEPALQLARELHALPEHDAEPHRARYEMLINDPDAAPFLAAADGEAAGLIVLRFRRRLNRATFEGWISDLIVREAFRRRGIGRALLEAAIAEWRLRQGHALALEVGDDRRPARALYARAGFLERERVWHMAPLEVPDADGPATIRPLERSDVEPVTRLLAELGRPMPSPERMPAIERTFADHARRPEHASLVADVGGATVGVVVGELQRPFQLLRPQLWISELVVTEQARGRRIGRQLIAAALRVAVQRDACGATLSLSASRSACRELLHRTGFREAGSRFVLD